MRLFVNMQSYMYNDAMKRYLDNNADLNVTIVEKPENVAKECCKWSADAVLMEVTGYTLWKVEERLKIRDKIKVKNPNCKTVLLIHENEDEQVLEKVKDAKKNGRIDQFVYSTVTAEYLAAILETL